MSRVAKQIYDEDGNLYEFVSKGTKTTKAAKPATKNKTRRELDFESIQIPVPKAKKTKTSPVKRTPALDEALDDEEMEKQVFEENQRKYKECKKVGLRSCKSKEQVYPHVGQEEC
jgi:hypothetical protein